MLKKRKYRYIIIKVIEVEDVKEIILKLTEQEKEERKKSYVTKKKDIRKCLYCGGTIDIAHEE